MRLPWQSAARLGPVLDFVAGPARPTAAAWWLLAGGVLVACVAGFDFWSARQVLEAQNALLSRLQTQNTAQQAVVAPRSGDSKASALATARSVGRAADPAADSAARDAAWAVARSLQHPWPRVFDSIDAMAPAGMRWLALEHDTGRPDLRLEGTARSSAAALALVDLLASQPLLQSVVLTRLDPADPGLPPPAVRFELSAGLALQATTPAGAQTRAMPRGAARP
jgi:Tfp pilus assembly protein PilN